MDAFLLNFCFHLMEDRIPNSKSGFYCFSVLHTSLKS